MFYKIAIDGPCSSGKSTLAKALAKKLSFVYVDTGAMYRSVGLYMINNCIDVNDEKAVVKALGNVNIDLDYINGNLIVNLNGEDVTSLIRTSEVSSAASIVSSYPKVRERLVMIQQNMGKNKSIIMDGRDIGTVVLPDASLKVFMTGSIQERARRRYLEEKEKGSTKTLNEIKEELKERDYRDTHRDASPLVRAKDAKLLNTTKLSIDEEIDIIYNWFMEKRGK